MAVSDLVVDAEVAEADNTLGIAFAEPMQHIDIMCTFLQQQAGAFAAFGMPILEVGIAAVGDKVPAPSRLYFTDASTVNEFFHLLHKGHVTHIIRIASSLFRGRLIRRSQPSIVWPWLSK